MPCSSYSISRQKRLLDDSPMENGKPPKTWDANNKEWIVDPDGTVGELLDSIPVDPEEVKVFQQTGQMPERVAKAIATDTGYYPDPYDD